MKEVVISEINSFRACYLWNKGIFNSTGNSFFSDEKGFL